MILVVKISIMNRKIKQVIKFFFHLRKIKVFFNDKTLIFINLDKRKGIKITENNISNRIYIGNYFIFKSNNIKNIVNLTSGKIFKAFDSGMRIKEKKFSLKRNHALFEECNGVYNCTADEFIKFRLKANILYYWKERYPELG